MIDDIRRDGIAVADHKLSGPQLNRIWQYLAPRSMYLGGHVIRYAGRGATLTTSYLADPAPYYDHALACYDQETVVLCPELLETALGYVDVAERYLEQEPVLYSMNMWWAFPGGPVQSVTQEFHRDPDDVKFLAMFFLLTDCSTDGVHEFKAGTQEGGEMSRIVTVADRPGTIFLADTRGFHRGPKPVSSGRLAAWARFGVSDPPLTYGVDGLVPIATWLYGDMTDRERRITRLITKALP